jgi:hypothetical protein
MSNELLAKAQTIIEQQEEQAAYLKERYNIPDDKTLAFLLEYIKTRNGVTAYRNVYGKKIASNVASSSASRKLKTVNISISEMLELLGHGKIEIAEALKELRKQSPDKYLTHLEKLHQLDIQKIEHSGEIIISEPDLCQRGE